jgi:hypothetical protein
MSMGEKLEGFETFRYRQRYRVQEDFGDGQITCATMTMVFGSEPSRPLIGIWLRRLPHSEVFEQYKSIAIAHTE